ncbi:MAG: L-serine ammonia-lyase, iron-sulfur-dependent, subunit alpha [bacterium]
MKTEQQQIIELIKSEVIPAMGCTEPIAVALCVAKATELLGSRPEKIDLYLSSNIIKNAMGVGIPGTGGKIGLPIAIALGATMGKSEYQLEVLKGCTPEMVENAEKMINDGIISISLKDTPERLYIETHCSAGNDRAVATIACNHTNFVYLAKNDDIIADKLSTLQEGESSDCEIKLKLQKVWDFAMTTPIDDLRFILQTRDLNDAVSKEALRNKFGHDVGSTILKSKKKYNMFGDSIYMHILARTASACDARMAGCPMAVMSNSGSGNQGISATMPVVSYAEDTNATEEQLIRALTLSHLTVIYIKQSLGRLSALCGCVVAATGSACGITYLMGGEYTQAQYAVKNMAATLTGMLCDGAKPSCALKVASGVSTAVTCALLAMEGHTVTSAEGIINDDVDISITNMTKIGKDGMIDTDRLVLDIMINKQ